MKLDRDIMVDLETLATYPDSVILTIAGVRFNFTKDYKHIDDPYTLDFFYCRVDPESQPHRRIDLETLAWWANQDPEVRQEAFDPEDRLSIQDAMTAFNYWASGADRYWANGAAFDFPLLDTCNLELGFTSPWRYWQVMDARTIYKLVEDHYNPKQYKHHALYDCLNQIQKLTDCCAKLKIDKIK